MLRLKQWGILLLVIAGLSVAQENTEAANYGLSLEDMLTMPTVTTSALSEQKVDDVPGTMTVITEQEIRLRGYNTVLDVLESVPSFSIARRSYGTTSTYVRNYGWSSTHMKVMINGHPVNDLLMHEIMTYVYYPLANVKQIEIIRGPGSALYGTDAFCAVMNIITKKKKGTSITLNGGQNSNISVNLATHSDPEKDFSISASFDYMDEKGEKLHYNSDFLTGVNNAITGDPVSLAPIGRYAEKTRIGGNISLAYKKFKLTAEYADQDLPWTEGMANIMNEKRTNMGSKVGFGDLEYTFDFGDNTDLMLKGSFERVYTYFAGARIASGFTWGGPLPGLSTPAYSQTFSSSGTYFSWSDEGVAGYYVNTSDDDYPEYWPDGGYSKSTILGDVYRLSALFQTKIQKFDLKFGMEGTYQDIFDVTCESNYNTLNLTKLPDTSVSGHDSINWSWAQDNGDQYVGVFGQCMFDVVENLLFIVGLREDYYRGSGSSLSPRAAVVWKAFYDQIIKLSYGRAFSAPFPNLKYCRSFSFYGDPDIKPQTIQTLELAWQNSFEKKLHYSLVGYGSLIDDAFVFDPNRNPAYYNGGIYKLGGVEFDARWTVAEYLNLWGTYSYNYARGENDDGHRMETFEISAPVHMGNIGVTSRILKMIDLSLYAHLEGEKMRADYDPHTEPVEPLCKVNAAVTFRGIPRTAVAVTVRNIFDETHYTQNTQASFLGQASQDFPFEGRQVLGKITYSF